MLIVKSRNPHEALPEVVRLIRRSGIRNESRNGAVTVLPEPVSIHYMRPTERVMFWEERDANPFFHLLEAIWMLAGRRDVRFPAQIVSTMKNFSDDGESFHGAYGYRWRNHFGIDQIVSVAEALRRNPTCRRQVVAMWDGEADGNHPDFSTAKDLPCNLAITFQCDPRTTPAERHRLNMTVFNRSNDAIWGALGANCVHFSILQEVIARACDFDVGWYEQVSANLHMYDNDASIRCQSLSDKAHDPYRERQKYESPYRSAVTAFPIEFEDLSHFLMECEAFCQNPEISSFDSKFLSRVVKPMYHTIMTWKNKKNSRRKEHAMDVSQQIGTPVNDWRLAAQEWMKRRM